MSRICYKLKRDSIETLSKIEIKEKRVIYYRIFKFNEMFRNERFM